MEGDLHGSAQGSPSLESYLTSEGVEGDGEPALFLSPSTRFTPRHRSDTKKRASPRTLYTSSLNGQPRPLQENRSSEANQPFTLRREPKDLDHFVDFIPDAKHCVPYVTDDVYLKNNEKTEERSPDSLSKSRSGIGRRSRSDELVIGERSHGKEWQESNDPSTFDRSDRLGLSQSEDATTDPLRALLHDFRQGLELPGMSVTNHHGSFVENNERREDGSTLSPLKYDPARTVLGSQNHVAPGATTHDYGSTRSPPAVSWLASNASVREALTESKTGRVKELFSTNMNNQENENAALRKDNALEAPVHATTRSPPTLSRPSASIAGNARRIASYIDSGQANAKCCALSVPSDGIQGNEMVSPFAYIGRI